MINFIKNNIKTSLVAFSLLTCLPSCNKDEFFELPDRNGIDAAIWDTDGAVQWHLSGTYNNIVPQFPFQSTAGDARFGVQYASDENYFANADQWARTALGIEGIQLGNNDTRLVGNKYQTSANERNYYWDIARCNDAIKYVAEGKLDQARKNVYLGQYHALRAIAYFDLVKFYGGVPLILTPQTPENIYQDGRKSAKECIAAIVSDLDKAMTMLEGFNTNYAAYATEGGKINTLIAACLKAKVLLYWASPQFNPLNDPKHPFDQKRWDDALIANKAAYDMAITTGARSLMAKYEEIFTKKLPVNTEAIFVRPYSSTVLYRGHNGESRSRPNSEGGSAASHKGYIPSIKMLESYPMKDGNVIGQSAYAYDPIMFWQNRDPRFEATIAYNGSTWALSGVANRRQWTYNGADQEASATGVYVKRFSDPALPRANVAYNSNVGGSGMDWIELRLAEVMLNLADCYNETGNIAEAKNLVRLIRQRAKIEAGTGDYGLAAATDKVGMRNLIIRERMIEFAFENKRNSDLRRTRTFHLVTGQMATIEIPLTGTAATTKTTLETRDANGVMFRDKLDINNKAVYTTYFQAPRLVTGALYVPYNYQQYYYFYNFHTDFVNSALNIATTIGWIGGTFDPLD